MRFKSANYADAVEAGNHVRQYAAKGNRIIECDNGRYQLDNELRQPGAPPSAAASRVPWMIPPGTKIEMDTHAVLESKAVYDGSACSFQLNAAVEIFGGRLQGPVYGDPIFSEILPNGKPRGYPHVCVVGWGGAQSYKGAQARIRGTTIGGGNFQLYLWNPNAIGCGLIYEDCTVLGGRWLHTNGNSGGDNGFEVIARRNLYIADWGLSWSDPADAQGARLHIISNRGGFDRIDDCEMVVEGHKDATDIRCLWTPLAQSPPGRQSDYEGGNKSAYIYATGTNMVIKKNGCAGNVKCVDQGVGTILAPSCTTVVRE